MLIFDDFATREAAEEFAASQGGTVFDSQEESDKVDLFPFELTAPIVLVPRQSEARERLVIKAADCFGGKFAGT